ncbi:MAG: DUF2061 domain-containing protein [Hydrogenophilus sp.]|nr:DUF2061 domain-containing protein [Hydrogenophilus sp.]
MSLLLTAVLRHRWLAIKTLTYFLLHITVAILVAYAITRDWQAALALSLIEPLVQSIAYLIHERLWQKRLAPSPRSPAPSSHLTPARHASPAPPSFSPTDPLSLHRDPYSFPSSPVSPRAPFPPIASP